MKEFGSDFHTIDKFVKDAPCGMPFPDRYRLTADGRQCILELVRHYKWKRLWMPEYFCYNIIEYLRNNTETEIVFYVDYPGYDDRSSILELPFLEGDALLRMNYFGMRAYRSEKDIPVPVIEDHSHDLVGDWARHSDADWCIASLRKIVPIPEGGIMWSPKGIPLNAHPVQTSFNEELARKRWRAMEEKSKYLKGEKVEKDSFRILYLETEDAFDELEISSIDERSRRYLERFDINSWYDAKKRNWQILSNLSSNGGVEVLYPEKDTLVPFSLIILFDEEGKRDRIKKKLIEEFVYPAVLWNVPDDVHRYVRDFSRKMLSVHCDGRYNESDVKELYSKINTIIQND